MVSKMFTSVSLVFLLSGNCWAASEPIKEVPVYSLELRQELETLSAKSWLRFDKKNRFFINERGRRGLELINEFAYSGCLAELAYVLLVDPVCVDCKDIDDKYPLEKALDGIAHIGIVDGCVKCMQLLIKCGANPNCVWQGDYCGILYRVPLICRAAMLRNFGAVKVLLDAGADVTHKGQEVLSIFVCMDGRNPCIAKNLREDQIKREIKELLVDHFITLLDSAAQKNDTNEFFRLFNFFTTESSLSVQELQALLKRQDSQIVLDYLREKQTDLQFPKWLAELIGE